MKKQKLSYRIFIIVLLTLFALAALLPFVYLVIASLVEDMSQVFKNGLALDIKPEMLGISNYKMLVTEQHGVFFRWFMNTTGDCTLALLKSFSCAEIPRQHTAKVIVRKVFFILLSSH